MESLTPTVVLASFAAIYAVTKGIKFFSSRATAANRRAELSLRAKKKRELRDMLRVKYAAIIKAYLHSRKSHLGSTRQVEIAHMTAQEIATSIHAGTLKAADAVAVFASRCIVAGKKLDIIAEELYTVGLEEAEKLDDNIDTYKNDNTKILLGVPISIKDHIDIEGYDSTCGLAVRCFDPAAEDAVVVKLLRQAGAIPIVRGNVPQCIMLPESDNLIWGQSKNPWNAKKTAGGSSGGDAALVSSRAIPISIGSDIGGSIRIPAHCCGVYGFKPTPGRISYKGCTVARPSRFDGQIAIRCTSGPLANRVEDLALVMKAWLVPEMSRLDPTTPMTGFDHDLYEGKTRTFSTFDARLPITSTQTETPAVTTESKTKLKVGYFVYDGYTDVAKTGERAVDETLIALKAAGHEVVPFTPPSIDDAVGLYLSILGADGGLRGFFDGLEGETLHSMYDEVYKVASLPDFLRPLVSTIFNCIGEKRSADLVSRVSYKSAYDHWDDITGLLAYTKLFTDQWTALGLDAVVCPGLHVPAFNHNESGNVLPLFVSCFLWNVLHYPVGAVPITHVLPNEDDYLSIAKIKDRLSHFAHGSMQASEGLPYGIQVACLPNHDELVLRVMKDIQDQLIIQESSSNVRADSKQTKFISPFAQKLDALDFAED